MTTYNDFTDWLFPGDDVSRVRNPSDVPEDIIPLLEEVQCKTGVPYEWLANTAGLVINGLAGAQCLWFLHGAKGQILDEAKTTEPRTYDLRLELHKLKQFRKKDRGKGPLVINWGTGTISEAHRGTGRRTLKLGKWLRKRGASPELMHDFETRDLPTWDWEISAHPYDVLTMSFERPWTSCMRPPSERVVAGEAQYGPLTDMAAGSAILFFYRPGAETPCGRMVLRPALNRDFAEPCILWPGRLYGCGPGNIDDMTLHEMLLPFLEGTRISVLQQYLCQSGEYGLALSRYIYSDTDHAFCTQADQLYDDAYEALIEAPWPDPKLVMEKSWAVAEYFQGELSTDVAEEGADEFEWDVDDMVEYVTGAIEQNDMSVVEDPDTLSVELIASYIGPMTSYWRSLPGPKIPDYIYDDVHAYVYELLEDQRQNREDPP